MPKNKKKENSRSLREKFANVFDMSKEVILDTSKITLLGNKEITVENYKAILECTEKIIKIFNTSEIINISGENLQMKAITQDILYIVGIIKSVNFLK